MCRYLNFTIGFSKTGRDSIKYFAILFSSFATAIRVVREFPSLGFGVFADY